MCKAFEEMHGVFAEMDERGYLKEGDEVGLKTPKKGEKEPWEEGWRPKKKNRKYFFF